MLARSWPREITLSYVANFGFKGLHAREFAVQIRSYSSQSGQAGRNRPGDLNFRRSCWGAALLLAGAGVLTLSERREVRHQKFRSLARAHCHTIDVGDLSERFNIEASAASALRLDDTADGEVVHAAGVLSREGEPPSHKLLGVSPPRALRMQFSVRLQ